MKSLLLLFTSLTIASYADAQTDSSSITQKVFRLGEITLSAKSKSPDQITSQQITQHHQTDLANALSLLPCVNLSRVGQRNESTVMIRGFNLRQVPLFIDGIPVYVPYDGYVDLGRFTAFDVAEIQVAKGFSSVVYGPNTLGGAINVISRKPAHTLEAEATAGIMSAQGNQLSLNAGGKFRAFYWQGSISRLDQQSFRLSDDFTPSASENGGWRNNAYRQDSKYSFKIGWTPKDGSEWAIAYTKQDGEKGNPPYTGNDSKQKTRFWQWPYWNKESVYFLSKNNLGSAASIQTRVFYDHFKNRLNAYDDDSYSTQNKGSSFNSLYNDDSFGGAFVYTFHKPESHQFNLTAQYKTDRHHENDLGEPVRTLVDHTLSFGLEDVIRLNEKWRLLPGISWNLRKNSQAEELDEDGVLSSLPSGDWNQALNIQAGSEWLFNQHHTFHLSVAKKTRFATIKDRFSYSMGAAIPNPDLKAENALHLEFGHRFLIEKLRTESSIFYSHLTHSIQQVDNVQPGIYQLQNTGKAVFYGAETSLSYELYKNISANGQYSFIKRKNLSDNTIKFTDVPDHQARLNLLWQKASGYFMIAAEYSSSRYSTSYGIKTDDFILLNTAARIPIYKHILLQAGINNIFDKNYQISEGFPEAGRNFFVNLNFNLATR